MALFLSHADVGEVPEHFSHHAFGDGAGVFHGRAGVDLQEPDVQAGVNHEVVAKYLVAQVGRALQHSVTNSEQARDDTLLQLRKDLVLPSSILKFAFLLLLLKGRVDGVLIFVQVCFKLIVGVHIADNLELFLLALGL